MKRIIAIHQQKGCYIYEECKKSHDFICNILHTFIIVGPMAIWVVHQKAAFPGELAKSEIEANATFSPTHHRSKTAEI
ncbi:hypothetical protein [Oceanobacillus jeddahense]|uniref:Uncharacterized protein n=1 Tax=Oceanobacillus jeddahense TaxID=1462527 RepID=A0ABY5K3V3_9BACI|nr:hypothetical protein [Oceanobacillus jeddahense]UUI05394.1 hypothetical protein NP439_12430 [Oceanobacillus jeddahense]